MHACVEKVMENMVLSRNLAVRQAAPVIRLRPVGVTWQMLYSSNLNHLKLHSYFLGGRAHINLNIREVPSNTTYFTEHQDNMSVSLITPSTPLLYRKIWRYRGIHYFLIFSPKHRLWVLIETVLPCTHNSR